MGVRRRVCGSVGDQSSRCSTSSNSSLQIPACYSRLVLGHTICVLSRVFFCCCCSVFETEKMKPKLKPTSLPLQGEEQPAGLEKFSNKKKKNAARRHKTLKRQLWRQRRPRFGDTTGVRRCQAPKVQTSKENMEIPADGGGTGNETIYIQESSRRKR